jgi:hypothetical protein
MNENKTFVNSKIYHVLRAFLNIGFWVGVVAVVIYMGFSIVQGITGGMKSLFNSAQLSFDGFFLNQAAISKSDTSSIFVLLTTWLTIIVGLLCVWLLRNIVNSLSDSTPFTQKNVNRIRIIGWVLFAQAYLAQLMNYLLAKELSDAALSGGTQPIIQAHFNLIPEGVLLALCVLILAEVFRYGCTLQNEHDTTV